MLMEPPSSAKPKIPLGAYTVVMPSETSGKGTKVATIRINEQWFGFGANRVQKVVASYLHGPDNESDYRGFAFVDVERGTYRLWKDYRRSAGLMLALDVLMGDPRACAVAYGMRAGRCWKCGRTLIDPESIARSMGPICALSAGF